MLSKNHCLEQHFEHFAKTCIFYNLTEGFIPLGIMPLISIPLSMLLAALAGLIVGLPSLRVKGIYLAVATLSANFIIIFIIEQPFLSQWTGGLVGIDSPNTNSSIRDSSPLTSSTMHSSNLN